jgi:hypothetical protein
MNLKTVVIVLNVFQGSFESFHHFKKRVPSKSKSEFRDIDFGIFLEQFKDVWASWSARMKYSRAILIFS